MQNCNGYNLSPLPNGRNAGFRGVERGIRYLSVAFFGSGKRLSKPHLHPTKTVLYFAERRFLTKLYDKDMRFIRSFAKRRFRR